MHERRAQENPPADESPSVTGRRRKKGTGTERKRKSRKRDAEVRGVAATVGEVVVLGATVHVAVVPQAEAYALE